MGTHDSAPTTVAQYIEAQVASGAFGPGSKVPTERALAELLGSSRHDIRRQLDVLEAGGRITREVGRGTFLTVSDGSATGTSTLSPMDLIAARVAWEPNLMTLVAVAATAEDFDEIRRCLAGGDTASTTEEFLQWDIAFHRALAMATHNTVVEVLGDMVEKGRTQMAGSELDRRRYTDENCQIYRAEHHAIADAVINRDTAGSHAAMRSHLETVRRHLLADLG